MVVIEIKWLPDRLELNRKTEKKSSERVEKNYFNQDTSFRGKNKLNFGKKNLFLKRKSILKSENEW